MKEIILASNNIGKVKEVEKLLEKFNVKIRTLKDLKVGEPVEDGKTFTENSIIKAKYAFDKTGIPTIADDSGFCIDTMNDFPGLYSARFIKAVGGHENAFKIINECINQNDKTAHFITSLAFIFKDEDSKTVIKTFEGRINGTFLFPARGNNGFGFDPVFIPSGYNKTFAEMPEEKAKISHRTIALKKFLEFFKKIEGNI